MGFSGPKQGQPWRSPRKRRRREIWRGGKLTNWYSPRIHIDRKEIVQPNNMLAIQLSASY